MIANEEYIKKRMKFASERMSASVLSARLFEFHKGQFLAFREILEPEIYGAFLTTGEKKDDNKISTS